MTARAANSLGLLACAALLGYAYYAQFGLHIEPCPLCIFQRVGVFAVGIAFALAAALDPVGWGRRISAAAIALAALVTVGIAARHLYIQSLPPDSVLACGAFTRLDAEGFPASRGHRQGAHRISESARR